MGEWVYCPKGISAPPQILTPDLLRDSSETKEPIAGMLAPAVVSMAKEASVGNELNPNVQDKDDPTFDGVAAARKLPPGTRMRLYQALAPDLADRGVFFGSQLKLSSEDWMQLDADYFSAPGGWFF